ncbi:hypothetical protein ACLMAJ_21510 [Nocardia sp. KC 131]|uniref:hypothetical protein n=1 Tax=Nocardia arseniciresistens TaxID=3392119 RepID=UPI00398F5669
MAAQDKRPRRGSAADEMLKLHRRTMVLDGRVYTVISLRPGSDFRFSTNHFHDTWHVLSDWRGARVLARLLWGLAYQRRSGTLIVIDPEHLDPNPFDAAPADPIVVVPSERTVFTRAAAVALRRQLPFRQRSEGTVRWQTFGLRQAVDELREWRALGPGERIWPHRDRSAVPAWVDRLGGLVTIFGAPDQLRSWATDLATLGTYATDGMDYTYLDEADYTGEVQIFRQYRRKVSLASQARAEVLARADGDAEELDRAIWSQAATIRRRRFPAIEQPTVTD